MRIGIAISTNLLSLLLPPLLQMLFMKFDEYHSSALAPPPPANTMKKMARWKNDCHGHLPHNAMQQPWDDDDDHSTVRQPVRCCLEKIFSLAGGSDDGRW